MFAIDIFWVWLNTTDSCAMMSAFWRQMLLKRQVQDGMTTAKVCAASERVSVLFQRSHKGFVKAGPNMAFFKKSTNNIQMVPRLSSQLCTEEWQVQQNHVEFFTQAHCVSTLTPSWALSPRPELCLASSDTAPALAAGLAYTAHTMQSLMHSFLPLEKVGFRLRCTEQLADWEGQTFLDGLSGQVGTFISMWRSLCSKAIVSPEDRTKGAVFSPKPMNFKIGPVHDLKNKQTCLGM